MQVNTKVVERYTSELFDDTFNGIAPVLFDTSDFDRLRTYIETGTVDIIDATLMIDASLLVMYSSPRLLIALKRLLPFLRASLSDSMNDPDCTTILTIVNTNYVYAAAIDSNKEAITSNIIDIEKSIVVPEYPMPKLVLNCNTTTTLQLLALLQQEFSSSANPKISNLDSARGERQAD